VCEREGAEGRVLRVRLGDDPDRFLTFSYAGPYLSAISDWTGREWRYEVDANGDLVAYTDPEQSAGAGLATRYVFSSIPAFSAVRASSYCRSYRLVRVWFHAPCGGMAGGTCGRRSWRCSTGRGCDGGSSCAWS